MPSSKSDDLLEKGTNSEEEPVARRESFAALRRNNVTSRQLRIITLNAWCLPQPWPIGSTDRVHRLRKIGESMLAEPYDIVGLQELWSYWDFVRLSEQVSAEYPFFHYFHSGFTGSGVCVFSRHPIVSTLTMRYSLNGFAHHIHRGDWFGGKVVGLCEIEIDRDIRVNFYTTHLHAEYDRENDLYLPHRTSQSFELAQFDDSKRIDYVLFKSGRCNVSLEECEITLNQISGEEINYSDHVGLYARFTIDDRFRHEKSVNNWEPNRPLLIEAIGIVSGGERRARTDRTFFLILATICLILILGSLAFDVVPIFFAILRFALTILGVFFVWQGFIGLTLERKALKAAKQAMQQILNN
uniref:sphingomyelin phosphodiesterase n=1 Tax=Caenorhabditis japonica TaxID=281687 RepID=A0A8R1DQ33_CAEJA